MQLGIGICLRVSLFVIFVCNLQSEDCSGILSELGERSMADVSGLESCADLRASSLIKISKKPSFFKNFFGKKEDNSKKNLVRFFGKDFVYILLRNLGNLDFLKKCDGKRVIFDLRNGFGKKMNDYGRIFYLIDRLVDREGVFFEVKTKSGELKKYKGSGSKDEFGIKRMVLLIDNDTSDEFYLLASVLGSYGSLVVGEDFKREIYLYNDFVKDGFVVEYPSEEIFWKKGLGFSILVVENRAGVKREFYDLIGKSDLDLDKYLTDTELPRLIDEESLIRNIDDFDYNLEQLRHENEDEGRVVSEKNMGIDRVLQAGMDVFLVEDFYFNE